MKFTKESECKSAREKIERYEQARREFDIKRFEKGGGYSPEDQKAILKIARLREYPDNELRSAVEVWEWNHNPPTRYFLYVNETTKEATTFTGDSLGNVKLGYPYKTPAFGCFPSERVPITVYGTNGCVYHGTYFKSSGDYARVKLSSKDAKRLGK